MLVLLTPFQGAWAQEVGEVLPVSFEQDFVRAQILEVGEVRQVERFGFEEASQTVTALLLSPGGGEETVSFEHFLNLLNPNDNARFSDGDSVILSLSTYNGEQSYSIYEPYRLGRLMTLFFLFVALVVLVSRRQGLMSLLALVVTLLILVFGILPRIVAGQSPFWVSLIGSAIIATLTFYLAHGFKKRTSLALLSTYVTLFLAMLLSLFSVRFSHLFGLGSESSAYLSTSSFQGIDLKGLLLGAIVIGTLGVLDDVTTAQTAAVHEIHRANTKLSFKDLYKRGLSVGREHISSLVNTLVLAYVGASFPVLLLITQSPRPLWVILNNEFLAEEIVRTLVGSTALVMAVPISTLVAAHYYGRKTA